MPWERLRKQARIPSARQGFLARGSFQSTFRSVFQALGVSPTRRGTLPMLPAVLLRFSGSVPEALGGAPKAFGSVPHPEGRASRASGHASRVMGRPPRETGNAEVSH